MLNFLGLGKGQGCSPSSFRRTAGERVSSIGL